MSRKPTIKIGEQFNHWIVIGYDKKRKKYETRCVCGNIGFVSSSTLKSGKSKSCGCKQKEFLSNDIIDTNYKGLRGRIYKNYKNAAKKRNYEFNLSLEEFSNLIEQNCFYCDSKPNMTYSYGNKYKNNAVDYSNFKYNGVDRINNSIGYIISNCVPCCKICNNSKSTLSETEWLNWIKVIYEKQFG